MLTVRILKLQDFFAKIFQPSVLVHYTESVKHLKTVFNARKVLKIIR